MVPKSKMNLKNIEILVYLVWIVLTHLPFDKDLIVYILPESML